MATKRKHGSQLIDEDQLGDSEAVEAARNAMDTPLVRDCNKALRRVARKHGLMACDDDGMTDRCLFPRCLVMGCEAEPKDEGET